MFGFFKKGKSVDPSKPWLQNRAWIDGRIPAAGDAASSSGLLAVGLVCGGISIGAFLLQYYDGAQGIKWGLPVVMLVFAICFTAGSYYTRALRRKFGRTFFKLDSNPGVVGGLLSGVIQIEKPIQEPATFLIKLLCLEAIPKSSSNSLPDNRAKILWESRHAVSSSRSPIGKPQIVPISFHIPNSALATDDPSSHRKISWQLEVKAQLHGLDFNAVFEVPVYRIQTVDETNVS